MSVCHELTTWHTKTYVKPHVSDTFRSLSRQQRMQSPQMTLLCVQHVILQLKKHSDNEINDPGTPRGL